MYCYGITQQGSYHIQNGTECQDFHYVKKVSDDCVVAAVADGLGSEVHSGTASKIAAMSSVEFCVSNFPEKLTDENVLQLISDSFVCALQKIIDEAEREDDDINQYDTTLCLAVYKESTVYFGQSGDGGIIVLCTDGHYEGITERQRDENGCVFPLSSGKEKWAFGQKSDVASLLLATDGMLDIFFPVLLHSAKVKIYIALAQFFMDGCALVFDELGETAVKEKMEAFVQSIPATQVCDDKTVLVVVNERIKPQRQDDSYYQIPNWAELEKRRREEFNRLAYPHIYGDKKNCDGKEGPSISKTAQKSIGDVDFDCEAKQAEDSVIADGNLISDYTSDKNEEKKSDRTTYGGKFARIIDKIVAAFKHITGKE